MNITKLPAEDAKLRYDIVATAIEVIEGEKIEVPVYTDEEIADFAYEWQGLTGEDTRSARRLLREKGVIKGGTVFEWIYENYSISRLRALYEFSMYCDWLNSKEVIQHFGADLLKPFMSLQGKTPFWSVGIPFHLVLQVAFVQVNKLYRTYIIRKWLKEHWTEAKEFFEENVGTIESFPFIPGTEYRHVYTQFRKMEREKTREWMRTHKEEVLVSGKD